MYPDILQVRKKLTTADIGNPKFFAITGFNEIRTISFMFPNPGTRIPAVKKPEKPRNSWVMKKTYLISGFGGFSGFGAEDRGF